MRRDGEKWKHVDRKGEKKGLRGKEGRVESGYEERIEVEGRVEKRE